MVLSGVSSVEPVHQVDLGADGDDRADRGGLDGLDDVVGGADLVGQLAHVVGALGVHDDDAVGVLGPEGVDVLRAEALVHRAVALPQQEGRLLDVGLGEAAELEARVPDPHVVLGVAQGVAGVAAEVLVGEEQDLASRRRRRRPGRRA